MINLKDILIGKPVKYSEMSKQKLSRVWGLPIMASDAVSSVAYACEEILLVLVPAVVALHAPQQAAYRYVLGVTLPIILLLFILAFSYSQIIDHYPNGGGAYVVSKENLGEFPSLIVASALIVDYVLTAAVSISSASAAIASAFPALNHYKVEMSLIFVAIITLGNLRGVRESSKVFGLPTYIFIFSMLIMIGTGLFRIFTGTLHPIVYDSAQQISNMKDLTEGVGAFILLRAFASGCSALTGVEAVSDAVPNFKEPSQRNAKQVLFMLAGTIMLIFGGTTILEYNLMVIPQAGVTVTSQIANAVFGHTFMYYVIQIFTALILILAANTSYNGLPFLLYILAHDGYVPRQFSHRGTKLSFSNGILVICFAAAILIVVAKSNVHNLIPVYSIGVFISFTLSQYGMYKKWINSKAKGWQYKSWINFFGALITLICLFVEIIAKWTEGSYILLIVLPILIFLMIRIKKHYTYVGKQLELKEFYPYYDSKKSHKSQCIVLVQTINKSLLKSLNYANSISDDIVALHICRHPDHAEELRKQWDSLHLPIKLEVILTPYHDIIKPLDEYIWERESKLDHGENLSVIIVKFISEHWYDAILHNQTTYFIERILSRHKNVSSIILPFHYRPDVQHTPDDIEYIEKRLGGSDDEKDDEKK
ncbi:amino acid permease [[Clostridium] cellulosi]|uniref:Amino acid permease n=1 Tax=[Clostridium] cellulosi TaxID=29343 RepID=A0A078KRA0_9FIRM|nr:amino acid permease [[Clostridium] cellulosi]